MALTRINAAGARVYKFYQINFVLSAASITPTDDYSFETVPTVNAMTYSNPSITLSIAGALSNAICGDQITLALFTNQFQNPHVNNKTADFYYTPNFEEVTSN